MEHPQWEWCTQRSLKVGDPPTGGIYDAQTQMASFNFVETYLRSVFGFLGVTDATFLNAGGTSVLNQGHDRNAAPPNSRTGS